MKSQGTYFPNLDGVRALACLSVFAGHMFDYINNRELDNGAEIWMYEHFIKGAGAMGVCLFFVLSGFLITYLLIREKDSRNTIHLGYFYMKRILRIWPLFFLVTITGFFLVPVLSTGIDWSITKQHLPWFLTFTNNFDRIRTGFTGTGNDSLGVLWSVAVEEQFYLLWPLLLFVLSKRTFPYIAGFIVLLSATFRYVHQDSVNYVYYHSLSVAGDLAMGGLAAYFGYYFSEFRNFFLNMNKWFRRIMLLVIAFAICNHFYLLSPGLVGVPGRFLLCLCFAWLICDQCFSQKNQLALSKIPFLARIGTISYGFYCFHMFVIMGFQKINVSFGLAKIDGWIFYVEFAGAFLVTTAVAAISYRFFERQFLKYRSRFDVMSKSPMP